MTKKMLTLLHAQLNHELSSFYNYLGKAAHFDMEGFKGFSKWYKVQASEEQEHMMKIYEHLIERGQTIVLSDVKAPKKTWKSTKEVFQDSLDQEKTVTKQIYALMDLAISEKDHATAQFLQWFVSEQVEEEASVADILQKFELIGDNKVALIMLDKELGGRSK